MAPPGSRSCLGGIFTRLTCQKSWAHLCRGQVQGRRKGVLKISGPVGSVPEQLSRSGSFPLAGRTVRYNRAMSSGYGDTNHATSETVPQQGGGSSPALIPVFWVACLAAALLLVSYIQRYGVNALYFDEWNFITLVAHSFAGTLTLGQLWAQHHENRMFVSNVIALAVIRLTHWNDLPLMYLGAAFLVATLVVVCLMFRDMIGKHPLWMVPVPFIVLTLAQYQNILWAFQYEWFLMLFCIFLAVYLLGRGERLSWKMLAAAAVLGGLSSYSSLQGLIVWAAGFLILLLPSRSWRQRGTWLILGVVATGLYFLGYNFHNTGGPPLSLFPHRLPTAAKGAAVAAGSIFPNLRILVGTTGYMTLVEAAGVVLWLAGIAVVVAWFRSGRPRGPLAYASALVATTFCFDILLMPGRLSLASGLGTVSRYTSFNWPLLVGIYVSILLWAGSGKKQEAAYTLRGALLLAVLVQIFVSARVGVAAGQSLEAFRIEAAHVTLHYRTEPTSRLAEYLYPPSGSYARRQAQYLQQYHLNVFSG